MTHRIELIDQEQPQNLSPCSNERRSSDSMSSEFEFWMLRNPSLPQQNLHSADQLFLNGVLLPLHLLPTEPPNPKREPNSDPGPAPALPSSTTAEPSSKRWRYIFKKGNKKNVNDQDDKDKEKELVKQKKERNNQKGASSAELIINIWPFFRSRSAGNNESRPRMGSGASGSRKVGSAPCSRSNSAGESKLRKWASTPGRVGVQLGRSSPVWQARRGVSGVKKAEVLNLKAPMGIGYKHQLSCWRDEMGVLGDRRGNNNGGGNLFNLRSLFSKKAY